MTERVDSTFDQTNLQAAFAKALLQTPKIDPSVRATIKSRLDISLEKVPEIPEELYFSEEELDQHTMRAINLGSRFFELASGKENPPTLRALRIDFTTYLNSTLLRAQPKQGSTLLLTVAKGMGVFENPLEATIRRILLVATNQNPEIPKAIKGLPNWNWRDTYFSWGIVKLLNCEERLSELCNFIKKSAKRSRDEKVDSPSIIIAWMKQQFPPQ